MRGFAGRRDDWLHCAAIGLVVLLVGAASISPRTPVSDEHVYLAYAFGLAKYGTFGLVTTSGSDQPPPSTARISPLVPVTHALALRLSSDFYEETACLLAQPDWRRNRCTHTSVLSHYLQLLLWTVCLAWVALQVARITGRWTTSYMVIGCVFLSGAPFEYIDQFNSEGIYLPLFFVFLVAFARAVGDNALRHWMIAAVALGLCALTRPVFFYLFWMLLALVALVQALRWLRTRTRPGVRGPLLFAAIFMLVIAPWLARNLMLYGSPTLTVGYGVHTLSYRIAYNRMTDDEYRAAWIYWLPDFGDSLAARLFAEADYRRLDLGAADGFHRQVSRRVQRDIEAKSGARITSYVSGAARTGSGWVLREYIVGDWVNHLKVTALLFWRGIMLNSYFGMLGLLMLLWALANGLRGPGRQPFLIMLGVCTLLSLFYAFVSLNIARYSAPMILPMSMAYAALGERLFDRRRRHTVYSGS